MPQEEKTLIMKFGGAAVKSPKAFSLIADLIIKKSTDYPRIACVVSAMLGVTDQLISLAKEVHPDPPSREYDMLVSTGERVSIALLAMALALKNRDAVSFTGSQSGIMTNQNHGEAKIIDVRPQRLQAALDERKIVIVAGFQGVSVKKEITTLGRGGSDTTAVALGIALRAERVEFYKDVKGIFHEDPKLNPSARYYSHLSYSEAIAIVQATGGKVVHPRAIRLAEKNRLPLSIRSFKEINAEETLISTSDHCPPCVEYEL